MATIALANELGGGWGHLLPMRSIAEEFRRRGCGVVLLCRDAKKAHGVFSRLDVEVEQSPPWPPRDGSFSLNFAHNLWRNGYRDKEAFSAHFTWWSERFKALRPGFVLADFAPTALLAALAPDIPRGVVGTGFTLPPMGTPTPFLHPWLDSPAEVLRDTEERVLAAIRRHVPSVESVSGLFHGAERFLLVFAEMDHYDSRPPERYYGTVFGPASSQKTPLPQGAGPRVFIYLSAANRCLLEVVKHVGQLGFPATGHIRDLPEPDREALESPTLKLSRTLVNLDRAAEGCDIAVTQGGLHTTARFLLSGARLLICPEQLEQTLLAYRMKQRGLCEFVSFFTAADKVKERFDTAASSAELAKNAASFASRYAGYDDAATVAEIVQSCLDAM